MQINTELAKQVMNKAKAILNREILVAGPNGLILAGKELSGKFIPEALRASQEGRSHSGLLAGSEVQWSPFVYEDQTVGVFGIAATDSITPEAVSLLQGLAEVVVHQHFLLDRLQSASSMRNSFVKEVLTATEVNTDEVYRKADILQLNIQAPQAVILVRMGGLEKQILASHPDLSAEEQQIELVNAAEKLSEQLRSGFKNYQDNIVVYMGDDTFALLKGIGGDNINTLNTIRFMLEKSNYIYDLLSESQQRHTITVGVGQYYPDLGGLRKSFGDAKLALEVGTKVWGPGRVYHIKSVGMFVTLAHVSHGRKAELAHQILSPLLRDQQLFKTVQTFLGCGLNLTEAATKLHIHRNTLIYRLDKTKKLINLDPRHFEDALQIKLGLMFY